MSPIPVSTANHDLMPVEVARTHILAAVEPLASEVAPIVAARGQVLDQDVIADLDQPAFDNSAMDGYAVRAADVAGATGERPAVLRVVDQLPAGAVPARAIDAGEAARIMTGAPIPAGADAVVIVEDTDGGRERVAVRRPAVAGDNIRRRGESVRHGAVVLARGTVIRPAEQSMLAALGQVEVRVIRRPRVALLSTGDELVPPAATPGPGQVRDSNRYGLRGQVEEIGAVPIDLGIVRDDPAALRAALTGALAAGDCVLASAGVSVGDFDLTRRLLAELGEIHCWRVAMKPGKPQVFGMTRGKPVFGLPGNPVSSLVVFDQMVRPALRKMAGYRRLVRPRLRAEIACDYRKAAGREHYLRAVIEERDGTLHARLTGPQGSGVLSSMTAANGLVIVGREVTEVRAGETVAVELWE